MKAFTALAAAAVLLASSHAGFAAHKTVKKMAAKTLTCPSCKMPMSTVKSAGAPIPVKVGKTTYYCCAACASGKKAAMMMKKK